MKVSKFYLLMAAGMAVVACDKSEVTDDNTFGSDPVSVSVDFVDAALVKAIETPTQGASGETAPVEYKEVTLKLTAISGGSEQKFTSIPGGETALQQAEKYVFKHVVNPMRIEVLVNGATEKGMSLTQNLVDCGLAAPYYGSESRFVDSGKIDEETKAKIFKTESDIILTPRMARIEMSGIKHIDEAAGCLFSALTFDGLYLNGAIAEEKGTAVNYKTWAEAQNGLLDITVGESFLTPGAVWPAADLNKCYAMNFFPAEAGFPYLTLAFSGAAAADPSASLEPLRYAVVKSYKNAQGAPIEKFEAGKIYRITKLEVADKNITDTTDPTVEEIAIQATVQVAAWTIEDTTVEWK